MKLNNLVFTSKVVYISENKHGKINLDHLEEALKLWQTTGLEMIGCFSAASNITGFLPNYLQKLKTNSHFKVSQVTRFQSLKSYINMDV